MTKKANFRIHPSIGFSRVGNSSEYNLAPETLTGIQDKETGLIGGLPIKAGTEDTPIQSSDLRDKKGALKQQAARFRIFHYAADTAEYPSGQGKEICIGSSIGGKKVKDIIWTVHLSNKKTSGMVLENPNLKYNKSVDEKTFSDGQVPYIEGYEYGTNPYIPGEKNQFPPLRNANFTGEERYRHLTIDPGPRTVRGKEAESIAFDKTTEASYCDSRTGEVKTCDYPKTFPQDYFDNLYSPAGPIETLGEINTDKKGRLIVGSGYGRAVSWLPEGTTLTSDTDNDGWLDDTSDGPVFATIIFDDGSTHEAENGWVVSTDPAYAPQVLNSVTLWDELYDTFVRKLALVPDLYDADRFGKAEGGESNENEGYNANYAVDFDNDIKPFLLSSTLQQWTTNWPQNATKTHNKISQLTTLKDFNFMNMIRRSSDSLSQSKMPLSLGDSGSAFLTPTKTQDHLLQTAYKVGETGVAPCLGAGELLDKAALMSCLGGRFSPGIDMTFVVRQKDLYHQNWKKTGPFRINARRLNYAKLPKHGPVLEQGYLPCQDNATGVEPGDTSKFMALPWHTDYNSCAVHNPSVTPENPKTLYWSWPAQRPYAVRLADEVQSQYSFPGTSISKLRTASSESWPKGVTQKGLNALLDSSEADILAIDCFSSEECIALVKNVVGDIKNSEAYVELIMSAVDCEITSDYRFSVRGEKTTGAYDKSSGIYYDRVDMIKRWQGIGVVMQGQAIDTANIGPYEKDYLLEVGSTLKVNGELENVAAWPEFPAIERELFYSLQNVDDNPNSLPKARMYTETVLKGAWVYANGGTAEGYAGTVDDLDAFFEYSLDSFEKRLDDVYASLALQEEGYEPATDPLFKNRDDVLQRIIQLAPFDLTDGAWLRNINDAGPISEVRAIISSIEEDERGNGIVSMNHCNIYLDLCHASGFYPHAVDSREFAMDDRFLDSSFATAAFELAISQFIESYFPELLGMTLQLEWSVLELKNTIKLLDYYGFDSHFYVMHVGIDNATNGHGDRAKTAIQLYLDKIRSVGGETAVQEAWKRIWTGYVAFGNWGAGGESLYDLLTTSKDSKDSLHKQMIALVRDKAKYGGFNHDHHQLGHTKINDWFADPDGFLLELQKAGYIIPGDSKNSRFFDLLEFETGPMYRVFTQAEIELWKNWTDSLAGPKPLPKHSTAVNDMLQVVKTMKSLQAGNPNHENIKLADNDGNEKSIAEWFEGEPEKLLDVLANPKNGWVVPGGPNESVFVTELLAPATTMGVAMSGVIPNTGGKTGREIAISWIESLKRRRPANSKARGKSWLSSAHNFDGEKRPLIRGMGTIH